MSLHLFKEIHGHVYLAAHRSFLITAPLTAGRDIIQRSRHDPWQTVINTAINMIDFFMERSRSDT